MKIVDFEKLWNCEVGNFFIWIRLGPKQSIYTRISIVYEESKRNLDTSDSVVQW
jgi:hypothetical protein